MLVTPSWLSGTISVVGGLALIAATLTALHFPGSDFGQFLQAEQEKRAAASQPKLDDSYVTVNSNIEENSFVSNLPLLVFWGVTGLIVYSMVINLLSAFGKAVELTEEMKYVNVNRHELINNVLTKFFVRVFCLAVWLLLIQLTLKLFIPYSVAAVQVANGSDKITELIGYLLMAFSITAVTLHMHAVLLRLIRLRPRVFGDLV